MGNHPGLFCLVLLLCAGVLTGCAAGAARPAAEESAFLLGMDASSVLAEEAGGAVYYGFDGREQDVFQTLAEAGVDHIRLRIWNDPFDALGRGYGGGNCDPDTAVALGRRAARAGMKVFADFHYSDFWADPKRQHAPKAWECLTIGGKCDALYAFTRDVLERMLDAGVDVDMVQIGNEINNGMAGESFWPNVLRLLKAGSQAVRDVSRERGRTIRIAVHFTDPQDRDRLDERIAALASANLDYDILALSCYPYWHGGTDVLASAVRHVRESSGKDVLIAETAYCYTAEDGDGFPNSVSGREDPVDGYPATVEGQTAMLRAVFSAAEDAGAIGVFYWEGVWIPVGPPDGDNAAIWETSGSGWASRFAGDYDPEDAGLFYGGCSWDNQALFDFEGHPLDSLRLFGRWKAGER